jgi:hypothetical protein
VHRLKAFESREAESFFFPFSFDDLPALVVFSFPFPDLPVFFPFILPDPFPLAEVAALRRVRALTSLGSSRVSKAEQVFLANFRSKNPSERVASLRHLRVELVWRRSLAVACHVHKMNKRSSMRVLCGSGRRSSITGIEH